tara:strand:+ start:63 stop:680 length:618 start_codon:yes stop_codon:yes gene_type:complete
MAKRKIKSAKKTLEDKAPKGEFLAYINKKEAKLLQKLGGSGKKINGIPSFTADTGPGGGATDVGSSHTGDSMDSDNSGFDYETEAYAPKESITSFGDNFSANVSAMGPAVVVPGAGVYAGIKTLSDTSKGRKAMGMKNKTTPTSTQTSDGSDSSLPKITSLPSLSIDKPSTFKRINFIRAKTGTSVSTRGTKSIQVQGHKKIKLY